jgi:RNase H-fold protein (predicted Holliday junction resolvase)
VKKNAHSAKKTIQIVNEEVNVKIVLVAMKVQKENDHLIDVQSVKNIAQTISEEADVKKIAQMTNEEVDVKTVQQIIDDDVTP